MHFYAKKAYQNPTVGFSFFATCGKIVPVMRQIDHLLAANRAAIERENLEDRIYTMNRMKSWSRKRSEAREILFILFILSKSSVIKAKLSGIKPYFPFLSC
jgi:hypothetical protein